MKIHNFFISACFCIVWISRITKIFNKKIAHFVLFADDTNITFVIGTNKNDA